MAKKNIGRNQDAEIKKQLRNFAKNEFNEKKPLEIRVLQLKPGVVFKKGSMLPTLLIKKLAGTAYVIYLDYGDQLKFYYFAQNGMSLGSSNFDKSKKLLKEMHGKATTLLKLPKIVQIIGLETENKKLRERWEWLSKKYSHDLGFTIKNLPAISVKKNIPKNSIRIGIEQEKDILHFDYDYYNSDMQDTILRRELFPILTKNSVTKETIQIISTIWAITYDNSGEYPQILKKMSVIRSVNIKAVRWIDSVFLPYIKANPEKKEDFGRFLVRACMIITQNDLLEFYGFFDVFVLWLMKFGIERYTQFIDTDVGIIQKSWLYFEMLELFYGESILCQQYGIDQLHDESLPLIHLCNRVVLGKNSKVTREFWIGIVPNYSQMETALENLHFSEFTNLIPKSQYSKNKEFLEEGLIYLLISKRIIADTEEFIKLSPNTEKNIEILIQNRTDWILKDVEFQAELIPPNRIILQKIDPPKLFEFAGNFKLKIKFTTTDNAGNCHLMLKMSFENPFNPN